MTPTWDSAEAPQDISSRVCFAEARLLALWPGRAPRGGVLGWSSLGSLSLIRIFRNDEFLQCVTWLYFILIAFNKAFLKMPGLFWGSAGTRRALG